MPAKTHPKGHIMRNTTDTHHDTSLVEAVTVNAKLGASVIVTGAGFLAGGFVSLADTATNHAKKKPDGIVASALSTSLVDQWGNARTKGYDLVEDAKDIIDFSKLSPKNEDKPNNA